VGSDSNNGVRHQRVLSPRLSMMMMMMTAKVAEVTQTTARSSRDMADMESSQVRKSQKKGLCEKVSSWSLTKAG